MERLHRVVGWLCIIGAVGFVLLFVVLIASNGAPPYYLSWKFLIVVPFVLIYGARELREAAYLAILRKNGIEEMPCERK